MPGAEPSCSLPTPCHSGLSLCLCSELPQRLSSPGTEKWRDAGGPVVGCVQGHSWRLEMARRRDSKPGRAAQERSVPQSTIPGSGPARFALGLGKAGGSVRCSSPHDCLFERRTGEPLLSSLLSLPLSSARTYRRMNVRTPPNALPALKSPTCLHDDDTCLSEPGTASQSVSLVCLSVIYPSAHHLSA